MVSMVAFAENIERYVKTSPRARGQDRSRTLSALRCSKLSPQGTLRETAPQKDAQLGSCSRDPIGYRGSEWSLYEYCSSNPLARTDPMGKDWSEWPSEYPRRLTPDEIEEMLKRETDQKEQAKLRRMKKIKEQMAKRIKDKVKNKGTRGNRGGRKGSTCKGLLAKLLLFECEAACAGAYNACLDRSVGTYEDCFRGAYSMDEPMQSEQISLCDRVSTLDFIDCGASYVACGLACLVGHDLVDRVGVDVR